MLIENVKVFRRKNGVCVEFIGRDSEAIEVELHGDDLADLPDDAIIARAKATMSDVGRPEAEGQHDDAGIDQTLTQP